MWHMWTDALWRLFTRVFVSVRSRFGSCSNERRRHGFKRNIFGDLVHSVAAGDILGVSNEELQDDVNLVQWFTNSTFDDFDFALREDRNHPVCLYLFMY